MSISDDLILRIADLEHDFLQLQHQRTSNMTRQVIDLEVWDVAALLGKCALNSTRPTLFSVYNRTSTSSAAAVYETHNQSVTRYDVTKA